MFNELCKQVIRHLGWNNQQVFEAFIAAERELSKSRVSGYFKNPSNPRYREMNLVDFQAFMIGLAKTMNEDIAKPKNLQEAQEILNVLLPDFEFNSTTH